MSGLAVQDNLTSYLDFGLPRRVATAEEHGDLAIPEEMLTKNGRLDLYPEVLGKQYFSVLVRGTEIRLKAGAHVGLIPLNDRVSIEVKTRVPVSNLERMLAIADGYVPHALTFLNAYEAANHAPISIIDVMTDDLLGAVRGLREEGLHRDYREVTHNGLDIGGRIRPMESALRQQRLGRPSAVFSRFDRSVDTPPNRCIKVALEITIQLYRSFFGRSGSARRITALSKALALFERVSSDRSFRFLNDGLVLNPSRLPIGRPELMRAVSVAKLIVESRGVNIRTRGEIGLPTILISMEKVFEDYVRRTLETAFRSRPAVRVVDGNKAPPEGAEGSIFRDGTTGVLGNARATPDTVIRHEGKTVLIIETKYKPQTKMPVREELDQVIAYGLAYACPKLVLVYPCTNGVGRTVKLGEVGSLSLYMSTIRLSDPDMTASEEAFAAEMAELAALPEPF